MRRLLLSLVLLLFSFIGANALTIDYSKGIIGYNDFSGYYKAVVNHDFLLSFDTKNICKVKKEIL